MLLLCLVELLNLYVGTVIIFSVGVGIGVEKIEFVKGLCS